MEKERRKKKKGEEGKGRKGDSRLEKYLQYPLSASRGTSRSTWEIQTGNRKRKKKRKERGKKGETLLMAHGRSELLHAPALTSPSHLSETISVQPKRGGKKKRRGKEEGANPFKKSIEIFSARAHSNVLYLAGAIDPTLKRERGKKRKGGKRNRRS